VQEGDPDGAKRRSEGGYPPLNGEKILGRLSYKIVFGTFPKKYKERYKEEKH
jgi:hypothetical protein